MSKQFIPISVIDFVTHAVNPAHVFHIELCLSSSGQGRWYIGGQKGHAPFFREVYTVVGILWVISCQKLIFAFQFMFCIDTRFGCFYVTAILS